MAGAKFEYDHSGSTFYFLLSFEALVLIPSTIFYFYPRSSNQKHETRDRTICHCEACCLKSTRLKLKEPYRKAKERFIKVILFLGWIILFLTAYKVAHLQHDIIIYDPFEILEIDPEASMAEIKKAYRRLSLIHHPDKHGGDEVQFMRIAKAYAALTDEESRKNWELYGNPDGPGPTSFGIALPSWIVEKENSVWVLGLYALVFMVALPVGVGIWWYRSLKYGGSSEALLDTSQLYYYFIYKTPYMIFKRVLMVLAASLEFEKSHNSAIVERETDNVEVPAVMKELGNVGEKNREKPLCFTYSIKARTLLHAHLSRLKLPQTLESDKLVILQKCPLLLQEFVSCCSQVTMLALAGRISRMPNLSTMENAIKLSQCLVQALWDKNSSLLQLPHIDEDILRHFTTRKRNIRSMMDFASMSDSERRNMLRSLSENEYEDVLNILFKMPVLELEVKSEVLDDEDACVITVGAIVTVTVTLIRRNLGDVVKSKNSHSKEKGDVPVDENVEKNVANGDISTKGKKSKVWEKSKKKPKKSGGKKAKKRFTAPSKNESSSKKEVNTSENLPNGVPKKEEKKEKEKSKEDLSEESDDDDASSVAASEESDVPEVESKEKEKDVEDDEEWEKFRVIKKKEKGLETKSKKSHIVHCPYFPDEKHEHWWIYISDKSRNSLITNPYFVTNLIYKEEVELKFAAPLRPGIYHYIINVRSDSYMDADVTRVIQLDVKEAKEVDLTKIQQWDVSEEEEEKDEEESAVEDSDLASDDEIDDE